MFLRRHRYGYSVAAALVMAGVTFVGFDGASSASNKESANLGASQGVTSSTITVGFSSGLQGPYALAGEQEESGLKAAFDQANAAGGDQGRKFKIVALNDNFSTTNQAINFRQLATSNRVYALVGTPWFDTTEIYSADKSIGIPIFPLFSYGSPGLKTVFLIGGTTTAQTVGIIPEIARLFPGKNVKVGELGGSSASPSVQTALLNELKKYPHLKLVAPITGIPFTTTDMTPYILSEKAANPKVIIMLAGSTQDLIAMEAAAQQNFYPLYIGNGGTMAESPMLGLAGCQNHCYRVTEYNSSSPGYQAFAKVVKKYTGIAASDQGAEDYAIAETFIHILKLCGKNLSWSNFVKTANTVRNFSTDGLYAPISYNSSATGHLGSPDTILERIIYHKWTALGAFVREPTSLDSQP